MTVIPRHVLPPLAPEDAGPGRDPRFALPQFRPTVRGVPTAVFDAGKGDAIAFIHGLVCNLTHWVHVAPHFARSHRVLGLDLPGCGASAPLSRPSSVAGYARHVVATLDRLGVERATLVGHSLGGMVATRVAHLHPERTDRVVLVNPAGFQPMPAPVAWASRLVMRPGVLSAVLPRTWQALLGQVFSQDNAHTRAFVDVIASTHVDDDIFAMADVIAALRPDFVERDYTAELAALPGPVAVIWGTDDRLIRPGSLRRATAHGRALCEEIEGCGHMPIIERPERVVAFLRRALEV